MLLKQHGACNVFNATDTSVPPIPQSDKTTQLTGRTSRVTKGAVQRQSVNTYHITVPPTFWKINGKYNLCSATNP
uniref:Uncharacterized protein n=1 Tax=Glossina palpalis gambiensis TaxID=67801 RepID=A0A1B0BM67_9MUSC